MNRVPIESIFARARQMQALESAATVLIDRRETHARLKAAVFAACALLLALLPAGGAAITLM